MHPITTVPATHSTSLTATAGVGASGVTLAVEVVGASAGATAGLAALAVVGGVLVIGGLIYLATRD
jgi:hypothetical protein